jgi:hypothetical protein
VYHCAAIASGDGTAMTDTAADGTCAEPNPALDCLEHGV